MTNKSRIRLFNNGRVKVWAKAAENHWRTKMIGLRGPLAYCADEAEYHRKAVELRWKDTCTFILNVQCSNMPVEELDTVPDRMTGNA